MVDFLSAIKDGVKNSAEVKRALEEVSEVLSDVSDAVRAYTKGELRLSRVVHNERTARLFGEMHTDFVTMASIKKQFALNIPNYTPDRLPEKIESPNALVLHHPTQRNARKTVLAKWEQDPSGYPCILTTFFGYEYICGDKQELVSAFMSILRHPEFNEFVIKATQANYQLKSRRGLLD